MHMHVVFTHHSAQDSDIFCITYLDQQFPATFLDISFENFISIFCYLNNVNR